MSLHMPTPAEFRAALDRAATEHGRRRHLEAENERLRVENEHLRALADAHARNERARRDYSAVAHATRLLEQMDVDDDYTTSCRRQALVSDLWTPVERAS